MYIVTYVPSKRALVNWHCLSSFILMATYLYTNIVAEMHLVAFILVSHFARAPFGAVHQSAAIEIHY